MDGMYFYLMHDKRDMEEIEGEQLYRYLDEDNDGQEDYYRLNLMDIDGTAIASESISTYCERKEFTVLNSGFKNDALFLEFIAERYQTIAIDVIDARGHQVFHTFYNVHEGKTTLTFPLDEALLPGIYLISITGSNIQWYAKRWIS